MDPYPIPQELKNLTQVEELLISQYIPFMSVSRRPFGQYAYSGHTINFPQDLSELCSTLPRLSSEVNVIVLKKRGSQQANEETFRVRRDKVCKALSWLKAHNQYYQAINISDDRLALLPGEKINNILGIVIYIYMNNLSNIYIYILHKLYFSSSLRITVHIVLNM